MKNINNAQEVREFYNKTTDQFIEVYGDIIQAFRTKNVQDYLAYTLNSARISEGEKILDAGCGICGPAVYIANNVQDIHIYALTISDIQVEKGKLRIHDSKNENKITLQQGDYHLMHEYFDKSSFDLVYFLESFGHSSNQNGLIDAVWDVLKPGGRIYIKDLFKRFVEDEWEQLRIDQICDQINKAYEYHICNLTQLIHKLRQKGFIVQFIKIPDINMSDFEKLTISNKFQDMFHIAKIDSWDNYIFPIDFYEILAFKPKNNVLLEKHLYHLTSDLNNED